MFPFAKRTITNFMVKKVKKMVPAFDLPRSVPFSQTLKKGSDLKIPEEDLTLEDVAFLQYTGGTTGVAKGAVLTHGNIVSNALQTAEWLLPVCTPGQDVLITPLPLYHVFALLAHCFCFLKLGGENVLITNPRDGAGMVKTMQNTNFTGITAVNTLFNSLLHTPGFDQCDFSRMHVALGGGMAVQRAVAEEWKKVTGSPIIEAYGLTETSPAACMNPMMNTEYNGSIGLPIPSTIVTIRDDDGKEVPIGKSGELCIQGPQVMREYWNRPDETAKVFLEGHCLRTGDIARMDENGFAYIEDRKKDMILVSGFNVYPNEVESVAVAHPGVLEVAAVGVPHERSGEIVKLFVVKKDPALTDKELIDFCRKELSAYKVPKQVEFRDSLPKSNVGKILRRALRDEVEKKADG
jgi:long-chain acyl-CoA synthetase